MPHNLRIRKAQESDLPDMTRISIEAFRGRPMNEAQFPPHLRVLPGDGDKVGHITERRRAKLDRPNVHVIVVVDDDDDGRVLGSAEWQSVPEPLVPYTTPEGREAELAKLPSCIDRGAVVELVTESLLLDQTIRDALGEEEYENSWYLAGISVDPAHQRKGIGRMLVEWGEERAMKEHKNSRLMATVAGSKLYRSMGYQEVGSRDILGGMEYAFIKRAQ